jgi:hypothetical protein
MFIPYASLILIGATFFGGATPGLSDTRSSLSSFRRHRPFQENDAYPIPYIPNIEDDPVPAPRLRRRQPHRRLVVASTLPIWILGGLGLASLSLAVVCFCAFLALSIRDCCVARADGAAPKSEDDDDDEKSEPSTLQDTRHSATSNVEMSRVDGILPPP